MLFLRADYQGAITQVGQAVKCERKCGQGVWSYTYGMGEMGD